MLPTVALMVKCIQGRHMPHKVIPITQSSIGAGAI